jgi:hypothetical protein
MIDNGFLDAKGSAAYGAAAEGDHRRRVDHRQSLHRELHRALPRGASRLEIRDNDFTANGWAVRLMADALDNHFTGNVFEANAFDVATNSRTFRSTFERQLVGLTYRGYDLDRDGSAVMCRSVRSALFAWMVERHPEALLLLRSPVTACSTPRSACSRCSRRRSPTHSPLMRRPAMISLDGSAKRTARAACSMACRSPCVPGRVTGTGGAQRLGEDHADQAHPRARARRRRSDPAGRRAIDADGQYRRPHRLRATGPALPGESLRGRGLRACCAPCVRARRPTNRCSRLRAARRVGHAGRRALRRLAAEGELRRGVPLHARPVLILDEPTAGSIPSRRGCSSPASGASMRATGVARCSSPRTS